MADVAVVHDYLTQRGGAERVVLALTGALPGAPVHTSFFEPAETFPEFGSCDVRPHPVDAIGALRRHHRLALPLLAPVFSSLRVDAAVAVCSSSGWAHGARVSGRKVVYCHNPARWLYQRDQYLAGGLPAGAGAALAAMAPALKAWDRRAAASAVRYLANSELVRGRIRAAYGIDAEVLHPPVSFGPGGPEEALPGVEPGFVLCVSRLLAYKNVEAVVAAFESLPAHRLVVVGAGPLAERLGAGRPANVVLAGDVGDATLRWLYRSSAALVAASYEDFGLTPVEAAGFAKPVVVLRWGGFLETVVEGTTGEFFDVPEPGAIAAAVSRALGRSWDEVAIAAHADRFSLGRFHERVRQVVAEEAARA